jgi:hypothetical protein
LSGGTTGISVAPPSLDDRIQFRDAHSVFSSNSSDGLITGLTAGTTTQTLVADSEVSYNGHNGVQAQTASTVTMSNTTVTHNENLGIGGNTRSFQDNRLYGNTTDGSFVATIGKL